MTYIAKANTFVKSCQEGLTLQLSNLKATLIEIKSELRLSNPDRVFRTDKLDVDDTEKAEEVEEGANLV